MGNELHLLSSSSYSPEARGDAPNISPDVSVIMTEVNQEEEEKDAKKSKFFLAIRIPLVALKSELIKFERKSLQIDFIWLKYSNLDAEGI